jgi:hypothetical protein
VIAPPALVNPAVIEPGAVFGSVAVVDDGATDNTTAFQAAINASDVCINNSGGVYAIAGTLNVPPGRNIQCQPGATILNPIHDPNQPNMTFAFGWSQPSHDASLVGCTIIGTDTSSPTQYDASNEYNYLVVVSAYDTGYPASTNRNILIEGNKMEFGWTDGILTYAGSNSATSGPNNVKIVGNTFGPMGYNCIHINGGQSILSEYNTMDGCLEQAEIDPGTGQVITATIQNESVVNTVGGNCGADGVHCGGAAGILGAGTSDNAYSGVNVRNNTFNALNGPVGLNLFGAGNSTHSGNTCMNGATGCP